MAASRPGDPAQAPLEVAPIALAALGVQTYSVSAQWVRNSNGLRFDASHYNPTLAKAIAILRSSEMELRPLGDVSESVFIPPRFKRVYVDKDHGIPFLQGSHIVHAEPADLKYLSTKAHTGLSRWIIRKGWVLVTCSGTIGRVTIARDEWDGWAASQHILRIVPMATGDVPAGYLYAFLRSFPGQAQLTSQIYGAVVDELTEDQAKSVLVPVPRNDSQRRVVRSIDARVTKAVGLQSSAVAEAATALINVHQLLGIAD